MFTRLESRAIRRWQFGSVAVAIAAHLTAIALALESVTRKTWAVGFSTCFVVALVAVAIAAHAAEVLDSRRRRAVQQ